jgi:hypothetical protein
MKMATVIIVWVGFVAAGCNELNNQFTWESGTSANVSEGNYIIAQNIRLNCKFMVYRIGGTEAACVNDFLSTCCRQRAPRKESLIKRAALESGVFPPREDVYDKFINLTIDAITQSNIYCDMTPLAWPDVLVIGNKIAPHAVRVPYYSITSFWEGNGHVLDASNPSWLYQLVGKVVLVVSMFHITGPRQYNREDSRVPRFKELKWIAPPQSYAGQVPKGYENKTWIDALDDTARKIADAGYFDVALLSCGAYGGPLQTHIRQLNASSIYVGGTLQAIFGIKGRRWARWYDKWIQTHPDEKNWWVKPDKRERPKKCDLVEDCPYHFS